MENGNSRLPTVELRGIVKRFARVVAIAGADLDVYPGEIHALLGENGAGKSTLMNILSGLLRPDEGEIRLRGERITPRSPKDAARLGIGMVHQEYRLLPRYTVAENLYLGWEKAPFVASRPTLARKASQLIGRYGLEILPLSYVWQLSTGEQQRVAILRALIRGVDVLILDEPTAVLTPQEAEKLFDTMRVMAAEGKTLIFISHKLDEVMAVADRVTVLRGGRRVGSLGKSECSVRGLAQLMVGRDIVFQVPRKALDVTNPVLSAQAISATDDRGLLALDRIDLTAFSGEILGIAGVAGNGQRELSEALTGLRPITSGRIFDDRRQLPSGNPLAFIRAGIGHIPEDRLNTGVALRASVEKNAILKAFRQPPIRKAIWLRSSLARSFTRKLVETYGVSVGSLTMSAANLSGGNIQRLVTGRELLASKRAIVAVHPTRGLDIGGTERVWRELVKARDEGLAIVLISEDLDEILSLSDRVVVLFRGTVMGEFAPGTVSREDIGLMMGGSRPSGSTAS